MSDRALDLLRQLVEIESPTGSPGVRAVSERVAAELEALGGAASFDAAEQATVQRATRFLERRMAADVARITADRYRRVRISDEDLSVDVFAPERGDWVAVGQLSRGTPGWSFPTPSRPRLTKGTEP